MWIHWFSYLTNGRLILCMNEHANELSNVKENFYQELKRLVNGMPKTMQFSECPRSCSVKCSLHFNNRVFRKLTKLVIMATLASEALLHEKIQWQNVTPSGIRTQASHNLWFQVQHYPLYTNLTSLKFCSCTTWYLDLDHLRRINRAWLYKEPKVSVLQANVKLV